LSKFKEYEITCHKGYLGDFTTEWWTENDWNKHREYVKKLEESGEYGKEFKVNVKIQHDSLYDEPIKHSKVTESYRMDFIDMSKIEL
jgi:hypothetical protein